MSSNFDQLCQSFPRLCPDTVVRQPDGSDPQLKSLWQAFERATGWTIGGSPLSPHAWKTDDLSGSFEQRPTPRKRADHLAHGIGQIWLELHATRRELAAARAKLASLSMMKFDRRASCLAEMLSRTLQLAAEFLGGEKAVFFQRDETQGRQSLEVRCSVGLLGSDPFPASRPLDVGSVDVEVLMGETMVAFGQSRVAEMGSPFDASSVICAPVASASNRLGTLWVDGGRRETFLDRELKLLLMMCGRLVAEIEKEAVLTKLAQRDADEPDSLMH